MRHALMMPGGLLALPPDGASLDRMALPRPRPALDSIPVYRAGKPATSDDLKLSSNENPFGPLPGVIERATAELGRMNRYPDAGVTALREAVGSFLDVDAEQVVPSTGSVAVLFALLSAHLQPGDEIVYAWRSFEAYPIAADLTGATSVRVPTLADGRHDLAAMAAAITERTRAVLVCTPNNPTGPIVTADELTTFLDRVPDDVLVVVDEAYVEFVRDPQVCSGLAALATHDNVVVLRTFSKAYGLAGLRVGYGIAAPAVADSMRKAIPPFSVTDVASAAAIASLEAVDELAARVETVVAGRAVVRDALLAQGWQVPAAEGNFVWLPVGSRALEIAAACDPVSVRPFDGDGVRITIGSPEANAQVVDALSRVSIG